MKKALACILMLAALLGMMASSAGADQGRVTRTEVARLLGDRLFALEDASIALERGHVFLMARDRRTRQLEWFLLDPKAPRILHQGKVPFQVYQGVAVSPDAQTAVVQARFPTSLWVLSLTEGRWTCALPHSNPGRLALTSLSSLVYTDSGHAWSMMDRHDAQGYVIDSVLVRFATNPFTLTNQISLRDLLQRAIQVTSANGQDYQINLVRFGKDGSCLFLLQSPASRSPRYLLRRNPDGNLQVLDKSEFGMIPLDYDPTNDRILYRAVQAGGPVLAMLSKGLRSIVSSRPLVGAALLDSKRIATIAVVENQLEISAGIPGTPMRKFQTVTGIYRAAFLRNAPRVVLWNAREIRMVDLSE
ncbi:MAG: hypothetical protein ACOX9B_12295 [Candidatus Xenobium sp.]|jgi:hypothetical protein|nr:hypothetical protein [Burkholderiales bacterium]